MYSVHYLETNFVSVFLASRSIKSVEVVAKVNGRGAWEGCFKLVLFTGWLDLFNDYEVYLCSFFATTLCLKILDEIWLAGILEAKCGPC